MQQNTRDFLTLAIELGVLRFGSFRLKSGRTSPYFFNAGLFNTGAALDALGCAYARAALESDIDFDMLFGPAYKGIPLVSVTAAALAREHGRDYPFAFNRKEVKDHGEGGALIGAPLEGRTLIVDDVITAGTAIREAVEIIRCAGAEPAGVLIALDRQERGRGQASAVDEVSRQMGLPVASIARLDDLVSLLAERDDHTEALAAVRAYRAEFRAN